MNDWLSCFHNTIWIFAYNLNAMGKNLQKCIKFTTFHEKYTGIAIHRLNIWFSSIFGWFITHGGKKGRKNV